MTNVLTKPNPPRKQQALRKQEMEAILLRQQQLEETNRHLCEKAGELRRSLRDVDISQDKYQELRNLPEDRLSIQEYVAVSMEELSLTRYDSVLNLLEDVMTFFTLCRALRCVSMRLWLLCGLSWLSSGWREEVWLKTWMHTEPRRSLWWRYHTHRSSFCSYRSNKWWQCVRCFRLTWYG